MSESSPDNDVEMTSPGADEQMAPPPEPKNVEVKYGGFSRFELELEVSSTQLSSSPPPEPAAGPAQADCLACKS